ncbi:MAG TPA: putative LPS assembly protein LptD [Bacteroidota bacterium]|nr:putative LPS assembly protein LptD [Bacteroidota bacterium]
MIIVEKSDLAPFRFLWAVFLPLFPLSLLAQETTQAVRTPSDTLVQAQRIDTVSRPSDIDTVVIYSAKDSIVYSMRTRTMKLYGQSDLQYRTMGLTSERVDVNWDSATLFAQGIPDTADSTGKKMTGTPILKDAGETYDGSEVRYNFRTKKGKITVGETEIEDGYYRGDQIKKIDKDVLFVSDGIYTTCDANPPHFHFYSPRMKIIVRDHIVAEPIYFYIADVPIFGLPFGIFPNKSGRRSGFIAPVYGYDARLGHFLSRFGYYWAINDYMDLTSTFDWYTRGGWLNQSQFRYHLRDHFTGSVTGRVTRQHQGEPNDPARTERRDYNIHIGHNQQIDPTMRADVNFTFSSGTFYRNFSTNIDEILQSNIVSTAMLSKTWEESNRNLTISVFRDQSLTDRSVREQLPSISFSQGQIYPFRKKRKSSQGSTATTDDAAWYEMIGFNYGASAANDRSRVEQTLDSVKSGAGAFSSVRDFATTSRQVIRQNLSTSISPKFGEFTISPSIALQEERTFSDSRTPYRDNSDSSLAFLSRRDRTVRGFLSTSVGTGTRLYGIVQPRVYGITAIRHTVTPNISVSYGKQIYGKDIRRYSLAGSLNVGNNFEMKYQPSDTAKEEKIQLMNIGMGLSYDFARESMNLSELAMSYRTDIGKMLNFSANTSHNFYVFDRTTGRRVDKYLISEKGYLADLTSFSLSLSTSFSGEKKTEKASTGIPQQVQEQQERVNQLPMAPGQTPTYGGFQTDESADFSIPWNLSLGYTFTQSQPDPRSKSRSSSLNMNLSFNLTEKWRISASGNYDFVRKELVAPTINVSRDLHCWTMNFSWFPSSFYAGYRFEIRIKAPQLQDIKVTKQGSARGVYY